MIAKNERNKAKEQNCSPSTGRRPSVDRSTLVQGIFVEGSRNRVDHSTSALKLCFCVFLLLYLNKQGPKRCKGTQITINKQPKAQLNQRKHEFNIHKFKNTSNTRNLMKVNQMVIKQGNEIPQFKQHTNGICKQKQKKAKVSTTTTKKSTIKPRSPAAAPFDEPSKYGVSKL